MKNYIELALRVGVNNAMRELEKDCITAVMNKDPKLAAASLGLEVTNYRLKVRKLFGTSQERAKAELLRNYTPLTPVEKSGEQAKLKKCGLSSFLPSSGLDTKITY